MADAEAEPRQQFEAIIRADLLAEWIDRFDSIVDEVSVHADADGLFAKPVDPANVAMINQWLHAHGFESLEATECTFGLRLDRASDFLGKCDSDELVALSFDFEKRKLTFDAETATYTMATIDPDQIRNGQTIDDTGILDREGGLAADVTLDGAALDHGVGLCQMVTDHLVIRLDAEADADGSPFVFVGEGDADDITVPYSNALHEGSTVSESGEAMYSLEYVESLAGTIPDDAAVRLRTAPEWPLLLDYETNDGVIEVQASMAPRIQSE